tara:strand:+ start:1806 stop:4151 length:2346 start_codon:yes stop_codon:yes gene_type:complete
MPTTWTKETITDAGTATSSITPSTAWTVETVDLNVAASTLSLSSGSLTLSNSLLSVDDNFTIRTTESDALLKVNAGESLLLYGRLAIADYINDVQETITSSGQFRVINNLVVDDDATIGGDLTITNISAGDGSSENFVVEQSGLLLKRTAAEVRTDLGISDAEIVDWTTDQGGTNIHAGNYTDTNTQLTDEQVQDKAGAMFTGNTETLITATYQDGDGTIDLVVDNDLSNYDNSSSGFITATLTTEAVQDIVGGMFAGNTETRIAATYEDGDGTIDLVVDDMTANTQTTYVPTWVDSSADALLRLTAGGAGSGTQDLKIVAGTGISVTPSGTDLTIANTVSDTNTNQLTTFTVSATTDSNATTISQGDDLMFTAGTGIACETTADGTVTITNTVSDTNTTYSAGSLLDLSTTTFNVDLSELTDGTADVVGSADELVYLDAGSQKRKQIDEIKLGQFNNDQSWTSVTNHITNNAADVMTVSDFGGAAALKIDADQPSTIAAEDSYGLHIDFDRIVAESGTGRHRDTGILVDIDTASLGSGSTVKGIVLDVTGATSGTQTAYGVDVTVGSADYNYAIKASGGPIMLQEQGTDAILDITGYGQMWIKTATPNELWFTNDAGDDIQLTSGAYNSAYAGTTLACTAIGIDAADASYSATPTFTTIDSGAKVTFVAPPSGNVEIFVSVFNDASSGRALFLGLSDNATYNAVDVTHEHKVLMAGDEYQINHYWTITGLTPGDTIEYWIGAKCTHNSVNVLKWGGDVTAEYGPMIIKATALPATIYDGS